jgi:methylase of polypeptide subunit release factors
MARGKETLAELVAARPWRGDETVVDVGGGNGALLLALLERRPGLRGIVFDLPEVAAEAEERIHAAGMADRCRAVGGSFFESVPAGGDVYVLSRILHG